MAVALPDRGAFEELLFSFADPTRALQGGLTVPSLSLAVRARAWAFVQSGGRGEGEARDVLSFAARDATVSELPAGHQLALLLDRTGEVEQLPVRELGHWLGRPTGPLQGLVQSVLVGFPGGPTAGALTAGAAALGLVYQFGTARLRGLGLEPLVSGSLPGGSVRGSLLLDAEPHFQTFRADLATHLRLPRELQLPLPGGRLELLELGVVAARTPEGFLLDAPWARLRGRVARVETMLGFRSGLAGTNPWYDVETGVQGARLGVRTVFSHHWRGERTLTTAIASYSLSSLMMGAFVSFEGLQQRTCGLVGMATF